MTDLTLRRDAATETGLTGLFDLLKEMFSATPLALMIAAFGSKR